MTAVRTIPCIGCGAPIKRAGRWGACKDCSGLRERFLEREVGMRDPNAWMRARNLVCGRKGVSRAVVLLERSMPAGVA